MATSFLLRVVDAAAAAGKVTVGGGNASATVAFAKRADADAAKSTLGQPSFVGFPPTHTHVADGRYEAAKAIDPGEWLLVVLAPDRSPVVQRVTISDDSGTLQVKAGWKGSGQTERDLQAAAVDIVNFKAAKANAKPPLQSMITVKLFPRREHVFMSGTEFHGAGTTWRLFAEGHRNLSRQAGKIGDGDLVTLLVCEQRKRKTFVRATGGSASWLLIDEHLKSGTDRGSPDSAKEPADPNKDLGIESLYQYLHEVGTAHPGSVHEVSVFSHAFFDGPILWDTFQTDGTNGTPDFRNDPIKRDPNDLDGRRKDWNASGEMSSFKQLEAAFAADGSFKIWGCNAERYIGQMIRQAQSKAGPKFDHDTLFTFAHTDTETADPEVTSQAVFERITLAHMMRSEIEFRLAMYCGAAALFLKRPVFGAPPGAGSNFGQKAGNSVMFVNQKDNAPIFSFYDRELAAKAAKDADGYYDFRQLLQASLPTPVWSPERHKRTTIISKNLKKAVSFVRLASGAFLARRTPEGTFKSEPRAGLVDPVRRGHLFIAPLGSFGGIVDSDGRGTPTVRVDPSTTKDAGVYMQDDGTAFLMTRSRGATVWVKETGPIAHFSGTPVTDGVLHKVTPGFIW